MKANYEDRERAAFKRCRTRDDYIDFMNAYPNGRYVAQADRIVDNIDFHLCKAKGEYEKYLEFYPRGLHAAEAAKLIRRRDGESYWKTPGGVCVILIGIGVLFLILAAVFDEDRLCWPSIACLLILARIGTPILLEKFFSFIYSLFDRRR